MDFLLVLAWICAHFISDWLLQPRFMAEQKSTDVSVLMMHLFIVGCSFWITGIIFFPQNPNMVAISALVYSILHGVQDWFIWRTYEPPVSGKYWQDKHFYDRIAVDQILHLCIGFGLFYLLQNLSFERFS